MSVLSALFDSGKIYNFEQAFGAKDITSSAMQKAIKDWFNLYYESSPTEQEDPCQRIPVAVVSKLTKTTFSEYKAETSKGEYIAAVLDALGKARKPAMQKALIGGECFLKPIFTQKGLFFSVIDRRNYLVLGRDEQDRITDIGTAERTTEGKRYYTLLERRSVDYAGYLTIESRLYQSDTQDMLGKEIPLATLEKYAMLEPINRLPFPLNSLGLIPIKTPLENTVDGSADGVSIYAPAAGLIHLINTNEKQINGEFERGESRIIVSSDLMDRDDSGRKRFKDHIFSGLNEDPDSIGVTIFSPELREQSFLARKQEYLRNVETIIGFKRGILSEVEAAERTATEVTSSAGDYNLTIIDIQQMWEAAVREAVRVCNILGQMYKRCDSTSVDPEQDVTVSWGNGILYDENKTWSEYTAMVASGLLDGAIALAWYFDLPFPETEQEREKIRLKYMPKIESLNGSGGDE